MAKNRLLASSFADMPVTLASANSYSHAKRRTTLGSYVRGLSPQTRTTPGNETFYLFGDIVGDDADALLASFRRVQLPGGDSGALSFGIAGKLSGVPFHTHGPVYADLAWGRKRWFLLPPHATPTFDPDATQLQWLNTIYPTLPAHARPLEAIAEPGQTLYIPNGWWHATLNLDEYNVFVTTFLTEGSSFDTPGPPPS